MLFVWIPVCYCQYCQKLYRKECGCGLPGKDDRSSPAFRRYVHWRNKRLYEFTRDLITTAKTERPNLLALFNSPRPHTSYPSMLDRAPLADIMSGDPCQRDMSHLATSFACSMWSNMTKNSPAQMMMGRFHLSEAHHTGMRSSDELMLSAMLCIAHNCSIEFLDDPNVDGTLYESPYRAIKKVFDAMPSLEPFLGGEKICSVGIYISEDTKDFLYESGLRSPLVLWDKMESIGEVEQYTSGLEETFRAFQSHHLPVDLITKLNLDQLEKYSLLVLPDAMCMNDKEVERIREYVRNGGNLVATRFTSLADQDGNQRHNFGLADVFGVDYLGKTENNETYIKVSPELCIRAGIPEDMEVKVDAQAVVKAKVGSNVLGHIVLPYTNRENDAERWVGCWASPPGILTDHPAVVMNRYEKGRCCYFSARIHTLNSLFSVEEPRELLYTLARSMLGDSVSLSANGPPWLVVTGFRKPEEKRIIVHVVNAQQEIPVLPVKDTSVQLDLARSGKVKLVTSYPGGKKLTFQQKGNLVSFTIPEIDIYQVTVIDLA